MGGKAGAPGGEGMTRVNGPAVAAAAVEEEEEEEEGAVDCNNDHAADNNGGPAAHGNLQTNFPLERDITLSMSTEIGKTRQFKQKKNRGRNNKNNEETQSNVILRFRPSKLNETQISATFKYADKNEVKEYINIFQEGDPKENLITLFKQVIDLGNLYDLWKDSFKTLCQVMARSLSGKPRE